MDQNLMIQLMKVQELAKSQVCTDNQSYNDIALLKIRKIFWREVWKYVVERAIQQCSLNCFKFMTGVFLHLKILRIKPIRISGIAFSLIYKDIKGRIVGGHK